MSSRSSSGSENSFDVGELLEISSRCEKLRKQKDMLKDSQSQSFELIRRLELHVKTLSKAQTEDKKCILQLERELDNCSQEIVADYLQDQLNARNTEVNCLEEHVCSLQLKVSNMESLEEEMVKLRRELKMNDSECSFLMRELENKDLELQNAMLCIEKLEASISSVALDYQCEIESLKLDLLSLEQNSFEARKSQEETAEENARMNNLIQDLERRIKDEEKVIQCLDKENKGLKKKLHKSEINAKEFCQKVEEKFQGWPVDKEQCSSELGEISSNCGDILAPLLSKLMALGASDAELKEKMDKMSLEIQEYELLVGQLKEELKDERLKAKEESEDLAQEMAELRYQITGLLEEECKRRAYVEQISLQRISELEAELEKERRKSLNHLGQMNSVTVIRHLRKA